MAVQRKSPRLAISKRLVTQMGGFISVSSEYGCGTEFRFVIPLEVKDEHHFAVVKEPQNVRAVGCFNGEQYERMFIDIGKALGMEFRCCAGAEELEGSAATHYFVGREKYLKNEEFFNETAKNARVFIVQERVDAITPPDPIKCVYKPFYSLPAVAAINGKNMVIDLNERQSFLRMSLVALRCFWLTISVCRLLRRSAASVQELTSSVSCPRLLLRLYPNICGQEKLHSMMSQPASSESRETMRRSNIHFKKNSR